MLEDEIVRGYFSRISEVFIEIKNYGGEKFEDEVVWKILNTLTHSYKQEVHMIEHIIPCTLNFTRETILAKL